MEQVKGETPFVSVIMPVRNEAAFIHRSLGSVIRQNYPQEMIEVIVVDGMSTDGTCEIVRKIITSQPRSSVYLLENPAHIVPSAINIGLQQVKGNIIIRVDGHCEITTDYISCCVKHLQRCDVDGVGGCVETLGESLLAQSIACAMNSIFGVGGSAFRTLKGKQTLTDSIPFPAYRRETICLGGLYDEEMHCNEDDEYNFRLRKLGMKLLLASDVKSYYYCRGSLNSLWRQYYRYGYWKVRVLQKHPLQMSLRQFVPLAFVLAMLGSVLLAFFSVSRSLSLVIPSFYILANFLATFLIASKRGWAVMPYLPVVFAILHLSYGLGFLVGLFKFWNRWGDKMGKVPVWSKADG